MAKEYTKEQLWKLYQKLPQDLKEAVFSADNADYIYDICVKNGLEETLIPEVAQRVGDVLMGLLPPSEFQTMLEKEVKLKKEVAKKVSQEINRFIFFPVKESLAQLFQEATTPTAKPSETTPAAEGQPPVPPKEDTYRESIE